MESGSEVILVVQALVVAMPAAWLRASCVKKESRGIPFGNER
jgi:hypothetical protein